MIIYNLKVQTRKFTFRRQLDLLGRPLCLGHQQMVLFELAHRSSVVHQLDYDLGSTFDGPSRELTQSCDEFGRAVANLPVVGSDKGLVLRSDDRIVVMLHDVGMRTERFHTGKEAAKGIQQTHSRGEDGERNDSA